MSFNDQPYPPRHVLCRRPPDKKSSEDDAHRPRQAKRIHQRELEAKLRRSKCRRVRGRGRVQRDAGEDPHAAGGDTVPSHARLIHHQ